MKKILASLLLLASQASFAQLSDSLSGTLGPGVYTVTGDIWVNASDTLQLMPGTNFLFGEGLLFEITGTLLAEGTESDSVIFTGASDSQWSWNGITFRAASSSDSRLSHCVIRWGGGWTGGGIRCFASSPIFSHCVISQNWTYSSGGGVYCDSSSSPTLNDCDIRENSASGEWFCGSGGGIYCAHSSPTFVNCRICNNGASWSSGAAECYESSLTFLNCVFSGNMSEAREGGALTFYNCSPSMINCTISNNGWYWPDEAICLFSSSLAMRNCIVAFSTGTGIAFADSPEAGIHRCDFSGNGNAAFGGDIPDGLGTLVSTNANGDSCDAYQNIFFDPMFINAGAGDYHLMNYSRCIGAGDTTGAPATDVEGNPRPNPSGSNPDIGAYENLREVPLYTDFSLPFVPVAYSLYQNFPNPFNGSTMIRYDVGRNGPIELTICNLLGQKILTLTSGNHSVGSYAVTWDAGNSPSGTYFCRMEAAGFVQTRRLVLVK